MNQQSTRTLIFVAVAAVCVAAAFGTATVTRAPKLDDTTLVGEQFYPDFTDPTKATSLRVAHYEKDSTQVKLFSVEFKNGLWRIPSHHDYPADGEKQLADTASSVIGIERGAYSGKTPDDQKRTGVLDPLDESITGSEGRGDRITLTEGDKTVVDFIIGNRVPDMENTYYVRRADEQRVYRARLDNLKVSTKFADWIEQDLLEVQSNKITDLVINRYHVDEDQGAIVNEEVDHLLKDDKNAWDLEGLDAETEKVKTSTVSSITFALQDLKIVGVRPKPAGLSAALRREKGAALNPIEIMEMQQRGFYVAGGDLVSNEGEILAGTNEGIRYTLRFGKVFTGSDIEIEAGKPKSDETEETDTAKTDTAGGESADAASDDADKDKKEPEGSDSTLKKNRYVLIRAQFDESLLGPRPVAPVKPEAPAEAAADSAAEKTTDQTAGATPSDANASKSDAGDAAQPGKADSGSTDTAAEQPESDGTDETKPAETKPDPKAEYEAALKKYEADQKEFEGKNKEFDDKVEAGKKLANKLDLRFANWYYVIEASQYDKLHVKRTDLVEPKEPPKATPSGTNPSPSGAAATTPSIPGSADTTPPPPPAAEAADAPKSEGDKQPEGAPGEKSPPSDPDQAGTGEKSGAKPPEGETKPEPKTDEKSAESAGAAPAGEEPPSEKKTAADPNP